MSLQKWSLEDHVSIIFPRLSFDSELAEHFFLLYLYLQDLKANKKKRIYLTKTTGDVISIFHKTRNHLHQGKVSIRLTMALINFLTGKSKTFFNLLQHGLVFIFKMNQAKDLSGLCF